MEEKKSYGVKFRVLLSIQFYVILLSSIVALFLLYGTGELTIVNFLIILFVCYNSYLPVAFADVLWSIERNTTLRNNEELNHTAQPASHILQGLTHTIVCPRCGAAHGDDCAFCIRCGAKFETSKEDG